MPTYITKSSLKKIMASLPEAAEKFAQITAAERNKFMHTIAADLEKNTDRLATIAAKESHLPIQRLKTEIIRTANQLRFYGNFTTSENFPAVCIDLPAKNSGLPDLRKTTIPIGPVVVFGSSNFPFAYSTAGGDTACAFAAGCPVIVKAHSGHPATSDAVAAIINTAVKKHKLPKAIFTHIHIKDYAITEMLVKHPSIKAVGFTGGHGGGMQMHIWANERPDPIPVFAEMGSTNPVCLLPKILKTSHAKIAEQFADSITGSAGQFCTKPGLFFLVDDPGTEKFISHLQHLVDQKPSYQLLNEDVQENYEKNLQTTVSSKSVAIVQQKKSTEKNHFFPTIAKTTGANFIKNTNLADEVFGPFALIVKCRSTAEMFQCISQLQGQLTATIYGTEAEMKKEPRLINLLVSTAGRVIFNGVPTGVGITPAMQHGGPYPATTDSRFTSVGADGVLRFLRPVCFQGCPDQLLPPELKNNNPLNLLRLINGKLSKRKLTNR